MALQAKKVLLETERLILRLPCRGDEEAMAAYYRDNRDFLQPWYPTFDPEIFSARAWSGRIEGTHSEFRAEKSVRFAIWKKTSPGVIGICNFTSMTKFPSFTCNVGYSLAETAQGFGYATEAVGAAVEYVFANTEMQRMEASYMPRNERSGRVLERLGFEREGLSKKYLLINGCWEDHVRTARIR